jgi:hypothetical protein
MSAAARAIGAVPMMMTQPAMAKMEFQGFFRILIS